MDGTDLQVLGIGVLLFGGFTHVSAETVVFSNEFGLLVMVVGLFVVFVTLVPGVGEDS